MTATSAIKIEHNLMGIVSLTCKKKPTECLVPGRLRSIMEETKPRKFEFSSRVSWIDSLFYSLELTFNNLFGGHLQWEPPTAHTDGFQVVSALYSGCERLLRGSLS
jgi:hypothetical protein